MNINLPKDSTDIHLKKIVVGFDDELGWMCSISDKSPYNNFFTKIVYGFGKTQIDAYKEALSKWNKGEKQ